MGEIDEKINSMLKIFNKDKPEYDKISKENLVFKVPVVLTLKAHIHYSSENLSSYNLTLKKKEITIEAGQVIYDTISSEISNFITAEKETYNSSFFIK